MHRHFEATAHLRLDLGQVKVPEGELRAEILVSLDELDHEVEVHEALVGQLEL